MTEFVDPLQPLLKLDGVQEAVEKANDYVARVHRHPANLKGWDVTGSEAVLRGARASAQLDGGTPWLPDDGQVDDPVLAGALRAAEMLAPDGISETQTTWRRAPLQVMAKLNSVASPQMSDESFRQKVAGSAEFLVPGRPKQATDARLQLLGRLITGGTKVNSVVLSAIIHGELLTLEPLPTPTGSLLGRAPVWLPSPVGWIRAVWVYRKCGGTATAKSTQRKLRALPPGSPVGWGVDYLPCNGDL